MSGKASIFGFHHHHDRVRATHIKVGIIRFQELIPQPWRDHMDGQKVPHGTWSTGDACLRVCGGRRRFSDHPKQHHYDHQLLPSATCSSSTARQGTVRRTSLIFSPWMLTTALWVCPWPEALVVVKPPAPDTIECIADEAEEDETADWEPTRKQWTSWSSTTSRRISSWSAERPSQTRSGNRLPCVCGGV